MSLGRQGDRQSDLLLSWDELLRSAGHPFYDQLQGVLRTADFDRFVEELCEPYYSSSTRGRSSLPPGRYFRLLLVGYFEGLDSERRIEWRCADSPSLHEFLLVSSRDTVPDHSSLSKTRSRLPLEVHEAVFAWVLARLSEYGLIKGDRIGVDASTMEANAALWAIVRCDIGEGYLEMLKRLAKESSVETPTADDLVRMDKTRPGKKLSNEDWRSPANPDARIGTMKDGRPRLGYKPEHAVDLDSGAIVAAPIQDDPTELVADKGYHSRDGLKDLEGSEWKTRIAEPKPNGILRSMGGDTTRESVHGDGMPSDSGLERFPINHGHILQRRSRFRIRSA